MVKPFEQPVSNGMFYPFLFILCLGDSMDYLVIALIIGYGVLIIKNRKQNKYDWKYFAGRKGELKVAKELEKLAQQDSRFKVYNDIRYRNAQIDHVVEFENKVFVIETKTWAGKITGGYNSRYWVQNGKKRLCNPIKQNSNHCKLLKNKYCCAIINIVVFAGSANPPHIQGVVKLDSLLSFIKCASLRYTA